MGWEGLVKGVTVLIIAIGSFGVIYPMLSNVLVASGITDPLVVVFITLGIVVVTIAGAIAFFVRMVRE